ncbi:SGNH/GDSL hydrolase family protein [Streptomyces sp. KR80]|uniref:SGNH/GDSL hydrolase family protein n=1 Tax=Streptomyces sp. KR80 TaxID=3457426 RepID=UPI003FD5248C
MKLSRFAAALSAPLLTAALAFTGAGAAHSAQLADPPHYVALGDSYSSGVGAGSYDSGSGSCKRSSRAHPALWAAANPVASFSFTACSGARTGDVVAGQLGPLNAATGLVSVTVGGNDAGFSDVMTTCVMGSESECLRRVQEARDYVATTLPGKLDQVYTAIRDRAPAARVVVLGYPRLFKLEGTCNGGMSERKRAALNAAADDINAVTAKRAADHGFGFGDVTTTFAGHEICSGDAWIHSVTWPVENSYHPTAAGQSGGYLPVLRSAT